MRARRLITQIIIGAGLLAAACSNGGSGSGGEGGKQGAGGASGSAATKSTPLTKEHVHGSDYGAIYWNLPVTLTASIPMADGSTYSPSTVRRSELKTTRCA
jgi:hypothetical protein